MITTSQVLNEKKNDLSILIDLNLRSVIAIFFSEKNWKIHLVIARFFLEMLTSCKYGLIQIQYISLYSVVCPKYCLGVYQISVCDRVQCNNGAQDSGKNFKRLNYQTVDKAKSSKKTKKTAEVRRLSRVQQIVMPSIIVIMRKMEKGKVTYL